MSCSYYTHIKKHPSRPLINNGLNCFLKADKYKLGIFLSPEVGIETGRAASLIEICSKYVRGAKSCIENEESNIRHQIR